MKRICFVTSGSLPVPAVRGGAVEQLVQQLCEDNERAPKFEITCITKYNAEAIEYQQDFHHTRFVNIKTRGKLYYWITKKIHGFIYRVTGIDNPLVYIYEQRANIYLLRHAKDFDMVIAEACDMMLLKFLSKKIGRERICLHLHGPLHSTPQYDHIFGNLLAVSNYIRGNYISTFHSLPADRALSLMNGIDVSRFSKELSDAEREEMRKQIGQGKDDFVIVFCGRIIKEKGVKPLIEAVLGIPNTQVKLLIIGASNFGNGNKGTYPQEVYDLANRHLDRIYFTGFVKNENLWKYYKLADIGIVPSMWNDPCPLVVFEMLASGLPTIATRMGGIPEIATSETTIFVDNDSCIVDSLREAILKLHSSPNKRKEMSQAAIKRSSQFDRDKYFETFCQQVNYLIGKNENRK